MTRKKTVTIVALLILIALLAGAIFLFYRSAEAPSNNSPQATQKQDSPQPTPDKQPSTFDKKRYSIDDPNSIWVVVNKQRPLLSDFVPSNLQSIQGGQLRSEVAGAVQQLIAAANKENVSLRTISAYRSFATQQSTYNNYVKADGQANADTYSARPGHSEHQTGLAADLGNGSGQCDLEVCFETTAGGTWLAKNAHTYGFIIRYTKNDTATTGYQYEPWHIRYVGVDLANELYSKGQTMETFFDLPAAPTY